MREKYPFTGHFGNAHAVIPTAEWGGGGFIDVKKGVLSKRGRDTSYKGNVTLLKVKGAPLEFECG